MLLKNREELENLSNLMEALDQMQIGVIVSGEDKRIINMNTAAEALTGCNSDVCQGWELGEVIQYIEIDHRTLIKAKLNNQVYTEIQSTTYSCSAQQKYKLTLIKNEPFSFIRGSRLEISEKNLRIIFDSVYDAIIVHDLEGNIVDVNKKMLDMYQIEAAAVSELSIKEDLSDSDNPLERLPEIWARVVAGEDEIFEWKARRPRDGGVFDVEVYLTRIRLHQQDAILANVRDISEKKKSEQTIKYLSFHDKLTGLYNRAFFEKELIRLDTGRQLPISIIIADVNGLKLANDGFGHLVGDQLLQHAAEALRSSCRKEDIIARWGGDEFAVILTNTDEITASRICERIQQVASKLELQPISLSIATGYAVKSEEKQDIQEVIKTAEALMYGNKLREGKENRRKVIKSLLSKRMEWDHDLNKMAELSGQLAAAYGFDERQAANMKLLTYIHDIGKVAVSSDILSKPSALNAEEWERVRKHSEIGYRIVSTYSEYAHLAESILAHHERWDGMGYPRGLKGEEIPLEARMLFIVDAFDAITSGRPYKTAMKDEEALEEICRNAGSQFDPKLVNLFIKIMKKSSLAI